MADKAADKMADKKESTNVLLENIKSIGIAVIAALIIRALVLQSYKIPSGSMEDTLLVGDVLFVTKFTYGSKIPFTNWRLPAFKDPEPGDIIVFKYDGDKESYIKRCIAIEGDTVQVREKKVYVNGELIPEYPNVKTEDPRIYPENYKENGISPKGYGWNRDHYGPVIIPEDNYFMMGDNRDNSIDSRYRGTIPRRNIVGKALILYWSWDSAKPLYFTLKIWKPVGQFFQKVRWSRVCNLIK